MHKYLIQLPFACKGKGKTKCGKRDGKWKTATKEHENESEKVRQAKYRLSTAASEWKTKERSTRASEKVELENVNSEQF